MEQTYELGEHISAILNGMYECNVVPLDWNTATGTQLGKANGKRGCKGIRIINLLSPEGKAFFSMVWKLSPERQCEFSYGFRAHRRREQAILVQNTVGWKLRKLGWSHYLGLHDVANAFPSMGHDALDNAMDTCTAR